MEIISSALDTHQERDGYLMFYWSITMVANWLMIDIDFKVI